MVPIFREAFAGPAAFLDPEAGHRVLTEHVAVGPLPLPTGRIAIHDPGYEFQPAMLDREVRPGIYPLDIVLRSWTGDDGRLVERAMVAAVRVSFAAGQVATYAPVRSADGARELAFGVDSGLLAIFDRSALRVSGPKAFLDLMPDDVPRSGPGVPPSQIVRLGGASIFVTMAGMGDGSYRAWWGRDSHEDLVELVVDFGLLEYSLWRAIEFPAEALLASPATLRLALAGTGLELERFDASTLDMAMFRASMHDPVAFQRPRDPLWEFTLVDATGAWVGSPGRAELFPGPWFEIFDRRAIERSVTVRARVHEGSAPLLAEPAAR